MPESPSVAPQPAAVADSRTQAAAVVCRKLGCGRLVAGNLVKDLDEQTLQLIISADLAASGDDLVRRLLPPLKPEAKPKDG